MIDQDGYRRNVGIILHNDHGKVFWAKRLGQRSWQFPQGGVDESETPEQAMYRELFEETGLQPDDVTLVGSTSRWLKYRLPYRYMRKNQKPRCIGQRQIWFLLYLKGADDCVDLAASGHPEFDEWRWVDHWIPARKVIFFKRRVYRMAMNELGPMFLEESQMRGPDKRRERRRQRSNRGQTEASN